MIVFIVLNVRLIISNIYKVGVRVMVRVRVMVMVMVMVMVRVRVMVKVSVKVGKSGFFLLLLAQSKRAWRYQTITAAIPAEARQVGVRG